MILSVRIRERVIKEKECKVRSLSSGHGEDLLFKTLVLRTLRPDINRPRERVLRCRESTCEDLPFGTAFLLVFMIDCLYMTGISRCCHLAGL